MNEDLRWRGENGMRISYKETLAAMAESYGRYAGRWHSNDFWRKQASEVQTLTEEQAEARVRQIEARADQRLAEWQAMQ